MGTLLESRMSFVKFEQPSVPFLDVEGRVAEGPLLEGAELVKIYRTKMYRLLVILPSRSVHYTFIVDTVLSVGPDVCKWDAVA